MRTQLPPPQLEGEYNTDLKTRRIYATDASAYRELPLSVAVPKTIADISTLLAYANKYKLSLIPRAAGTSLAGQVVGKGIVVDVSKNFTKLLEVNKQEQWCRVEPGINRDDLNLELAKHGLFFGPETSTSNRCKIGGMIGNNSCGSNSVLYKSTREHLISVKAILADGSQTEFGPMTDEDFYKKCSGETAISALEKQIYNHIKNLLSDPKNREEIEKTYPKKTVTRRNTGYALDLLAECSPFTPGGPPFNFCRLIAGSEGTLCLITEAKLNLVPVKPPHIGLVCAHFTDIYQALEANLIALKHNCGASELIDEYIIACTKENREQSQNRFFIKGDPGAILVVEFARNTKEEIEQLAAAMQADMEAQGLGYHFPLLFNEDSKKVWELRKAGLGLLANLPGDPKAVPVIEDTAVDVQELPAYIKEFNQILKKHNLTCVYYAHAGSGELHLRPILDLKTQKGTELFRTILKDVAELVKKYRGSLSGEHGDGRLRGEFIEYMVGPKSYGFMKAIKQTWDSDNVFNANKIVDTPPMNTSLRYRPGQKHTEPNTIYDFSDTQGLLRMAEKCNGTGVCRKTHLQGGTMCPSYMATLDEDKTTRARANILREILTENQTINPYNHQDIYDIMSLCLSCKGCKTECPSNVDVAKLKSEFLQHWYDANGIPLRTRLVADYARLNKLAALMPWAYNFVFGTPALRKLANKIVGFAPQRTIPLLSKTTFIKWFKKNKPVNFGMWHLPEQKTKKVYLFADEFTNYNDVLIGQKTVWLLTALGYSVEIPHHTESGRASFSKGLVRKGKKIAQENIQALADVISADTPLIGIEPSAILSFRDEYPDLAGPLKQKALHLAQNTLMVDEFIARERDAGRLHHSMFTTEAKTIKLHGHCQQKAIGSLVPTKKMLTLPKNYTVQIIPSGCCGMAGSFGYEAEKYELSMKVAELVLLPTVRALPPDVEVAAPGTSCRHQIKDGTGRIALHPVEILWDALI